MSTSLFYQNLHSFEGPQNLLNKNNYTELPNDWHVVVTDIKGSTKAIEEGRYKDVNVVGVSTIISVRNSCPDIEIAYIFGGDGATMFIPAEKVQAVRDALVASKQKAAIEFKLDLRAAIIPYSEIKKNNAIISIAKLKLSSTASIAMASGNGLAEAEALTKKTDQYEIQLSSKKDEDIGQYFNGLECRWNPIPTKNGEIFTAIIEAKNKESEVLEKLLKDIYSELPNLKLVESNQLSTKWPPQDLLKEFKVKKIGPIKYLYFYATALLVGLLTLIVKLKRNDKDSVVAKYLEELAQNTDYIKYDEVLRMVVDVSPQNKETIFKILKKYKDADLINFGTHSSKEAMMTCFIQTNKNHIHFVDGGNGGYALAAKQLKASRLI